MASGIPSASVFNVDSWRVEIVDTIFREYDIRGTVPDQLNAEVVELLGVAIGSLAAVRGQGTLAVGRDGRNSSPELADALIRGLLSTGRDVINIGVVPTPVLSFATFHLDTDSGVMVTGSHNDPEYNGLKITLDRVTLFGNDIRALHERINSGDFTYGAGRVLTRDIEAAYIERIREDIDVPEGKTKHIVIDAGNGVAGPLATRLMRALGHDVLQLNCEVDGSFPHHSPDPTQPENLAELIETVRQARADVGFALDGDGDRLAVVDSSGKIIWPDRQLMLLARDVLSRIRGGRIIYDVKCSRHIRTVVQEAGGVAVMCRTGHSLVRDRMLKENAVLAGELSGHIFFKERWYGFDDALYAMARILEICARVDGTTEELFATLPEGVSTPELRLPLAGEEVETFMQKMEKNLASGEGVEVNTLDGVRVELLDAWGLIRASNTTPCLVMRFEADNEQALHSIQERFRTALKKVDSSLQLPF